MSKDGIREIRKRVFYIICTLSFLIGSTIIWSNYKDKINLRRQIEYNNIFAMANEVEFREINNSIDVSSLGKVSDKDSTLIEPYKFSIKNISDETKDFLLCFRNDSDKDNVIPNNYINNRIQTKLEEF